MVERKALDASRRCREPKVGAVARLGRRTVAAEATISSSRLTASALFWSWLREDCALMTMTPSLVMR